MAAPIGKLVSCSSLGGKFYRFAVESNNRVTRLVCQRSVITKDDKTFKLTVPGRDDTARITLADLHHDQPHSDILVCRPLRVAESQLQCLFVLVRQSGRAAPDQLSLFVCLDDATGRCSLTAVGGAQHYDTCEWTPRLLDGPALLSKASGAIKLILLRPNTKGNKIWNLRIASVNGCRLVDAALDFYWKSSVLFACLTLVVVSASGAARLQVTLSLATPKHVQVRECWRLEPGHLILEYMERATVALLSPRNTKRSSEQVLFLVTAGPDARLIGVRDRSVPMDCRTCVVPLDDVVALDHFRCGPNVTNCCALMSSDGRHCVVDVDSFQVISTRVEVSVMLADDFLHTGCLQIFYMFKSSNLEEQSTSSALDANFEITNLLNTYGAKDEKLLQSQAVSHLMHLQRTVFDIKKTLGRLTVGDQEHFNEKPYMFQLLTGDGATPTRTERHVHQSKPEDSDHNCRPLDTEPPWQRIVVDTWVIGVRVSNRSHKRISNFHIVLSAPETDVAHETRFVRADDQAEGQPEWPGHAENSLEPGQKAFLLCTVGTDILKHRESLTVGLTITFKSRGHSADVDGCVTAGQSVVLRARDLVGNTLDTRLCLDPSEDHPEAIIDFAALQVTTNPIKVRVMSTSIALTTMRALLEMKTHMIWNERFQILVWPATTSSILNGVWLQVCPCDTWTSADVVIHSRSRAQFFAVIHYLNICCPDDVTFKVIRQQDASTELQAAIKDEANFVSNFLEDSHDQPHDSPDIVVLAHDKDVLLDAEAYCKFRNDLFDLETISDLAFASELSLQS